MDVHGTLDLKSNSVDSSHFENNFKRTINCPATRAIMNEPNTQQSCGSGAEAIFDGWSRSQKLSDGGVGACNLGSGSTVFGASELYRIFRTIRRTGL